MVRRFVIVLAVLAVIWFGVSSLGTILLVRYLSQVTGLAVEIDGVGLAWAPPGIALRGVRLRGARGAPPALRVERIAVTPELSALLRGEGHFLGARALGPTLRLALEPDGTLALAGVTSSSAPAAAQPAPVGVTLRLDRLEIARGRLAVIDRTARPQTKEKLRIPELRGGQLILRSDATVKKVRVHAAVAAAGGTGRLAGRLRTEARTSEVRGVARLRGIDLTRARRWIPALRAGRLDADVGYRWAAGGASPLHVVRGRVGVARLTLDAGERRVVVGRAEAGDVEADLRARTARLGRVAAVSVEVTQPDLPAVLVDAVRAHDLSSAGASGIVTARATLATGGRLRARGTLDPAAPALAARVKVDGADLVPLITPFTGGVRVKEGWMSGMADVTGPPLTLTRGTIMIHRFGSVAPREGGEDPVLAWDRLGARIERVEIARPSVRLRRLDASWPYLVVRRDPEGLYPLHLLPIGGVAPPAGAGPIFSADVVSLAEGGIFFEDRVVKPNYLGSLNKISTSLRSIAVAPFRAADARIEGLLNEVAPLSLTAKVGPQRVALTSRIEQLPLAPLNPYLAPTTGYVAREGSAEIRTEISIDRGDLDSATSVVLSRLDLAQAGEKDLIGDLVGVPYTLAIALMKDYQGRLNLDLPIRGNVTAGNFDTRGLVLPAIRDAIVGAISSPLRLLGVLLHRDGGIGEIRIDPVPFVPGRAAPTARGERQLDLLAVLLAQRPAAVVTLRGLGGDEDAAALRDGAVLERLKASTPSAVRKVLGLDATERAIVAHLTAQLDASPGPVPTLDEKATRRLEELRAAVPVAPEQLDALAAARAEAARTRLVESYHVAPERVTTGAPSASGPAAVLIEIGAVAAAPLPREK